MADGAREIAAAVHLGVEPFHIACAPALDARPLARAGVCFNPSCAAHFTPARAWQVYCSAGCRAAGEREFRKVGHMAAPALLAHRMGKYELRDADLRNLSNEARKWLGQLQTQWLCDRARRQDQAQGGAL